MSEWRTDLLTGRTVVIAPERARRPLVSGSGDAVSADPFLEGHEFQTPPELYALREAGTGPDAPGWRVRVVPNMFPAVRMGEPSLAGRPLPELLLAGVGAHEVIIECPHGETNLGRLPDASVVEVLHTYRERLRVHSADPRLKFAVIFKNQGPAAGATVPHCHSQLIATPCVLPEIARQIEHRREYFRARGRSVYDDMIRAEQEAGSRIVADSNGFLAWCPHASRFSYEVRIFPERPGGRFEAADDDQIQALGLLLKQSLRRLETALDDPPLNFILHTAPFAEPETPGDRWWFEIIPRLSGTGGFEWGSGCTIATTFPEDAARVLREVPMAECPDSGR